MIKEKTNPLCFEKNTRFRSLFHKNPKPSLVCLEKRLYNNAKHGFI